MVFLSKSVPPLYLAVKTPIKWVSSGTDFLKNPNNYYVITNIVGIYKKSSKNSAFLQFLVKMAFISTQPYSQHKNKGVVNRNLSCTTISRPYSG